LNITGIILFGIGWAGGGWAAAVRRRLTIPVLTVFDLAFAVPDDDRSLSGVLDENSAA